MYYIYVKSYPVRYNIKKPGGFPPNPPGKPEYDNYGFYTDEYSCKLEAYNYNYKRWEKHLKAWEETFGVPFEIIDEPDTEYLRKKKYGLLQPLNIKYDGKHPIENIIE
tara:strand:- start:1683 stop:2006 length:324 start_codon:yes stop_codon:yes gene_type:complete